MDFKAETIDQPIYIKNFNTIKESLDKQLVILNNGTVQNYSTSLLVLFDKIIESWNPNNISQLTNQHIKQILEYNPEIILIGTGDKLITIDYEVLEPLYNNRVPFEVMSTINACRTYNLLAGEHRNIAAGLIL